MKIKSQQKSIKNENLHVKQINKNDHFKQETNVQQNAEMKFILRIYFWNK